MTDSHVSPTRTVTVSHAGRSLSVAAGSSASFGRAPDCDVRLPADAFISRHAGDIEVLDDAVVVWNRSATKPLIVRPLFGADVVVEAGGGHAPPRDGSATFEVLLAGRDGLEVVVRVDTQGLRVTTPPPRPSARQPAQHETERVDIVWRPHEKRVLIALCEPLLTQRGPSAAPATYARMANRLDLRPGYVRNVVRGIREQLVALGLADLTGADTGDGSDLRFPLAMCALRHRWVTLDDLRLLDGRTRGRRKGPPTPPEPNDR